MRLTTLARKVGRTPSQLISFLQGQQIDLSNGANTKLDDATIAIVIKEYPIEEKEPPLAPIASIAAESEQVVSLPEVIPTIQVVEKTEIAAEVIPQFELPDLVPTATEEPVIARTGTIDDLEAGDHTEIEHIKAKKVKLEGFKVVGKIELPQKTVKAPVVGEEIPAPEESKTAVPEQPVKKQRSEYRKPEHREKHERTVISYDERLKKEEQTRKKEIQKKVEEAKAKKQRYYEQHIAPKAPNKPLKKKTQSTDSTPIVKPAKVVYKNPITRFWAWINGKFDNY